GNTSLYTNRAAALVIMGGRLKPGVSLETAAAEVDAVGHALEREHPDENKDKGLRALASSPVPGNTGPIAVFVVFLVAIVSTVLVVARAQLAGVLLARASARRREIAIGLPLGSARWRLVRHLLTSTVIQFARGSSADLALTSA